MYKYDKEPDSQTLQNNIINKLNMFQNIGLSTR
jgi:hypothetical protein